MTETWSCCRILTPACRVSLLQRGRKSGRTDGSTKRQILTRGGRSSLSISYWQSTGLFQPFRTRTVVLYFFFFLQRSAYKFNNLCCRDKELNGQRPVKPSMTGGNTAVFIYFIPLIHLSFYKPRTEAAESSRWTRGCRSLSIDLLHMLTTSCRIVIWTVEVALR